MATNREKKTINKNEFENLFKMEDFESISVADFDGFEEINTDFAKNFIQFPEIKIDENKEFSFPAQEFEINLDFEPLDFEKQFEFSIPSEKEWQEDFFSAYKAKSKAEAYAQKEIHKKIEREQKLLANEMLRQKREAEKAEREVAEAAAKKERERIEKVKELERQRKAEKKAELKILEEERKRKAHEKAEAERLAKEEARRINEEKIKREREKLTAERTAKKKALEAAKQAVKQQQKKLQEVRKLTVSEMTRLTKKAGAAIEHGEKLIQKNKRKLDREKNKVLLVNAAITIKAYIVTAANRTKSWLLNQVYDYVKTTQYLHREYAADTEKLKYKIRETRLKHEYEAIERKRHAEKRRLEAEAARAKRKAEKEAEAVKLAEQRAEEKKHKEAEAAKLAEQRAEEKKRKEAEAARIKQDQKIQQALLEDERKRKAEALQKERRERVALLEQERKQKRADKKEKKRIKAIKRSENKEIIYIKRRIAEEQKRNVASAAAVRKSMLKNNEKLSRFIKAYDSWAVVWDQLEEEKYLKRLDRITDKRNRVKNNM